MIYFTCMCGEILANKIIVYEQEMKKICIEMGIDFDLVSRGVIQKSDEYKQKQKDVLFNKCKCRRTCCVINIMEGCDIVQEIKG